MTQPMPRMSLLSKILIFMITAVSISSAQQTKVISPPEFANQGKDDLPFSPGILVGDTLPDTVASVGGRRGSLRNPRKIQERRNFFLGLLHRTGDSEALCGVGS
jgi:hypothetical protein